MAKDLVMTTMHRYSLNDIAKAYQLFGERRDGVMKVAITP